MSRPADHEDLLGDVLAEAEPPDFRATLLGETLRLARRRRRVRHARRVALLATPLLVLGLVAWYLAPPTASPSTPTSSPLITPVAPPYALIHTRTLPDEAITRSRPLGPESQTATFASIATIHTPPDDRLVRIVGDDELLALAAPRPAALIRVGPQSQELVFPDIDQR